MDPVREFRRRLSRVSSSGIDTVEGPLFLDARPLPNRQQQRIIALAATFSDVVPRPVQDWVDDFSRDADPEKELAIWDRLVSFFMKLSRYEDALRRKQELLYLLLDCAEPSPRFAGFAAQYRYLTAHDMREIRHKWST